MRSLVWFRADLRCLDNSALCEAIHRSTKGVVGVFLYAPQQWKEHDWGDRRVSFLHRNVLALSESLAALNVPLLLRSCGSFLDAPDVLDEVAREHHCDALFFNKEYEYNEDRRDQRVLERMRKGGRDVFSFDDQLVLPPGSVTKKDGGTYTVFTPFKRTWIAELSVRGGVPSAFEPKPLGSMICAPDKPPSEVEGYDLSVDREDLWGAGEEHAHQRLRSFANRRIANYQVHRDLPSVNGTSTLSPYLALGVLSPRQCLRAALESSRLCWPDAALGSSGESVWISELIWREFYRHLIVAFPRLCMYQAFKQDTERLPWRENEDDFQAWCEGRTGFPIIDAAMRQLQQTGWMHNRLRMIVAMFLTKQLLIDWRKGEKFFMERLVDGDFASNNGGWQWSASTGTDAAPYFRIFNPWSQSKRFDKDASFIKKMLPALADVPSSALHDPVKLAAHRPESYPAPICDHKFARQRAIDAFKAL